MKNIQYPMFFQAPNGHDFWKIESPQNGHFFRNQIGKDGSYCYQSNSVREVEIGLVMKDTSLEKITEREYVESAKYQFKRNQTAILRITEKLLEL